MKGDRSSRRPACQCFRTAGSPGVTGGIRSGCTAACYHRFPVVKLLLISILIATFFLPVAAAKVWQPRRALLSLLFLMFTAEVCYAVFLVVFYRRYA
jgi:cellulose synthase/poly-beta-1,6-N-acetylglucosamine synthase-like glycosyltransferase